MAVAMAAITCALISFAFIGYQRAVLVPRATLSLGQWSQVLATEAAGPVAAGRAKDVQALLAALAAQPGARWAAVYTDQTTLASYVRSQDLKSELPATVDLATLNPGAERIVTVVPAGTQKAATLVVDFDSPQDAIPVMPLLIAGISFLVVGLTFGWLSRYRPLTVAAPVAEDVRVAPNESAALDALASITQGMGMAGGRMNADTPMFDHEAWLAQLDGDTEHMRLFADAFICECDQLVKEVGDAVARRDYLVVERLSNGLQATLLTVCATVPAHAATRLAAQARSGRPDDLDVTYAALLRATGQLRAQMSELMVGVQVA